MPEYSANKIKRPKAKEKQVECFSAREQKKIEEAALSAKKDKYRGIILCLYTGLRIGELLALTWNDIDFEKSILSVTKTCRDGNENGEHIRIIDTPKTENSRRQMFATRALECGMDVESLSEILGHKNATITLNRYAHSL